MKIYLFFVYCIIYRKYLIYKVFLTFFEIKTLFENFFWSLVDEIRWFVEKCQLFFYLEKLLFFEQFQFDSQMTWHSKFCQVHSTNQTVPTYPIHFQLLFVIQCLVELLDRLVYSKRFLVSQLFRMLRSFEKIFYFYSKHSLNSNSPFLTFPELKTQISESKRRKDRSFLIYYSQFITYIRDTTSIY